MRITLMLILSAFFLLIPLAHAEESSSYELARKHYEIGRGYYNLAKYKEALEEFHKAYSLEAKAALLYNIARCHEKQGNIEEAIHNYRLYLEKADDIANREEIESRIGQLEKKIEPKIIQTSPPPDTTPSAHWKRIGGFVALGVGIASLVTGIAFGAMVRSKSNEYKQGIESPNAKTYTELQAIADTGRQYENVEIATLVVGGLFSVVGGSLLLWDFFPTKSNSASITTSNAPIAPLIGKSIVGLMGIKKF